VRERLASIAVWVLLALSALGLLATVLYNYGGMERRTPEMRAAYDRLTAAGRAPAIEERFVIRIPGCRCHSDKPVVQAQHSVRRIRECRSCHG
jgi:hypothetical protein